jgi:hypothetical protein
MTISVGTFDDLQPDRRPVDRNPSLSCNQCGAQHDWQDYWEPRMTDRDKDPDRPLLCDDCLERADVWHDRWTDNRQLSEFTEGER